MAGEVIACHKIQEWNEHIKKANESKKLIVIDFTASWCPPCRLIAPVFAEFAKKFGSNAFFFKIDVDELAEVAQEFQVEAMPTFVFMREGQVLEKMVGAQKDNLQTTIGKHIGASTAAA